MQSLTLHSHVGTDGILHLDVPVSVFHQKVEVTLTVKPIPIVKPFPMTRLEEGLGCVKYQGKAKSLAEMEQGILNAARQQWFMEWVLRSVYELKPPEILKGLLQILGLPNVVPESPEQIALALEYYRQGMDFADALHLVAHSEIKQFYTFDQAFVKKAKHILPEVTLVK